MMSVAARRHTRAIERLSRALPALGIDAIDSKLELEVHTASGLLLGDIDLLVRTSSQLLIIEYKVESGGVHEHKRAEKAFDQLEKLSACFDVRLGFRPRSLYVSGPRFAMREYDGGFLGYAPDLSYVVSALDTRDS